MAVLGDLTIPCRAGGCSLLYQNDAPALRERDWKEPNRLIWGARGPEKIGREIWLTTERGLRQNPGGRKVPGQVKRVAKTIAM